VNCFLGGPDAVKGTCQDAGAVEEDGIDFVVDEPGVGKGIREFL